MRSEEGLKRPEKEEVRRDSEEVRREGRITGLKAG
jgi:hypothetical protein